MQFGEWVAAQRARQGWSLKRLADALKATGLTQASAQYIQQVERGEINPGKIGRDKLEAFAAVFGTSVDAMLNAASPERITVAQLRAEGIPDKFLRPLTVLAQSLNDEDWEMLVEVARRTARKNTQQRHQGTGQPTVPEDAPEISDMGMQRTGDGRHNGLARNC